MEQTTAARDYSVLLPVANQSTVHQLANLATLFAKANHGELFALHVIKVPPQLGVTEGRNFLEQGRPLLEDVIGVGQTFDVPVRTMLRLGRDVARSMVSVARERETNLMVLGGRVTRRVKPMCLAALSI